MSHWQIPPTWVKIRDVVRDADRKILRTLQKHVPPDEAHLYAPRPSRSPRGKITAIRKPNGDVVLLKAERVTEAK